MNKSKAISIIFILILLIITVLGSAVFSQRAFSWIILSAAVIVISVFFTIFESKDTSSGEAAIIAVLTALSIIGRLAFAAIPAFKPCCAVIIIAGIYFGAHQGFMVGALTALVSNFYFSQGMWTPFQMIIWGLTGFFAGILSKPLSKSRIVLSLYGLTAGAAFSLFMDFWSVIWADNAFNLSRYLAALASSSWFTVCYGISNVIFLMLFFKPAKRIFGRLSLKYAIGKIPDNDKEEQINDASTA